ncbi:MAG TPA: MFS transporter [Steroidobacteraceae bacterium]|nr:MFS transporter [Steroidobacteraceae bacterium]
MAQRRSIRRVAFASFIGTAVEWYDFFVYGTAAALVFPRLFFPHFSALSGTLASFATFGVAFFARPIGGVVFGHFGDRVGRKVMLVLTLLLMGGATFLIGVLPTFNQIGLLAPLGLVVLRFVQGFAVGGEWGGATLMAVEHAPEADRNFYASWPQLGVPAGLLLSTAVFAASATLPRNEFLAWGWRVPFLLSLILILVGLFIRTRLSESPAFAAVKGPGLECRVPLLEVLRNHTATAILAIGVVFVSIGGFYVTTTFALSYLTERLGVSRTVALVGLLVASGCEAASVLVFARVADRIGKRPVAIGSAAGQLLLSYPFFWLLDTRDPALIWLAIGTFAFAGSALYAITGVFLAELFEARVRYSGISLGYQMAGMLAGAPAPLLAAALIDWSGGRSWSVATYLAATALVSLIAICLVSERHRIAIHGHGSAAARLAAEHG